ncbi:hypothetical protein CAPTEDRAFT_209960 [Capitella teleta]|uniref:Uncharacterized protein n=1 Tax=Capitella teleta TaxID=283909 RepID=R7VC46_CAPTE|nr:hypothetical protein CAPTEDRAFT_209960 [Capitella teleta]|eukprot:ELU13245.1 hypothetical protein CAPTEDRAFT_209960 [Capitella teleta]
MSSADLTESRLSKHCRMDSGEPDGSQVVPCADESLANFEDVEKELDANENIIEDGLITKEMIKEEQTLHQQSMDEDKRWRQKKEKSLEEMATQEKEERYDKLKKLLRKSTVYTNYLIDRMEQQRQDEKVFREQRQKKLMERAAMKAQKQASEGISVEGKEERKSGRVLKQQVFNSQKEAGASDRGTKRKKTESPIVKKRLSDLLSPRQTKRRKVEKEEEEESQEQGESDDDEHEMEACDQSIACLRFCTSDGVHERSLASHFGVCRSIETNIIQRGRWWMIKRKESHLNDCCVVANRLAKAG